ncbi:MAG TPA: carbohydrate porin [Vicinamibacterales bacterium]|nr:carbohydrate porin [Vicinamibacterales bacterium]
MFALRLLATLLVLCLHQSALAQAPADEPHAEESPAETSPAVTMLPHSDSTKWWISGQINLIGQGHGAFLSPYEGPHSLRAAREWKVSRVWTIFTGLQLPQHTEVLYDIESAAGRGLSDAFGLAGFTNLDVVRNPDLGAKPYVARVMIHYILPLSDETINVTRGPLSLATKQAKQRLEVRAGKFGIVDFFDLNAVGNDSHLQFTNWTIDNNGAYDYDADTRGYTYGVMVEYDAPAWSLRAAEALMPKIANGIVLDWNVARARGENVELELRPAPGLVTRILGYVNHANMGSYDEAIQAFRAGVDPSPTIEAHRRQGRLKSGIGGNVEYAFAGGVRLGARAGWNDGRTESFAYTEVDDTVLLGGDVAGGGWHRPLDRIGIAGASNGLSGPHREYLRLGGLGFLLGDGTLRYGRENILETYYTAHLWRGLFASSGLQYIAHPGYNRDRGSVLVGGSRVHVDF